MGHGAQSVWDMPHLLKIHSPLPGVAAIFSPSGVELNASTDVPGCFKHQHQSWKREASNELPSLQVGLAWNETVELQVANFWATNEWGQRQNIGVL